MDNDGSVQENKPCGAMEAHVVRYCFNIAANAFGSRAGTSCKIRRASICHEWGRCHCVPVHDISNYVLALRTKG